MLLSDQGGEIGMMEEKVGGLMDLIWGDLDVTGRLSGCSLNFIFFFFFRAKDRTQGLELARQDSLNFKHCPLLSNVGHFAQ